MKMDLRGSFVRGDTASVQSAEGRDRIVKNRFTFFAQIIVVYMIIITSLVQISLRSPDKELWLILLSSSIGYILPSPGLKFRKQTNPVSADETDSPKNQTMNNFYLTLLSDSSLSTFSKNTQCDFKVKLDHSIQIEKDNWEVGLVEVITPTEVNNITKENNYVILRFTDRKMCEDIDNCTKYVSYVDQKIYIQNGYYASPRHLVEEIQKIINFRYGLTLKNSNATITISYGENSARVKLDVQDPTKVQIIFPKAIAEILGVDRNYFDKPVGNEKYIFRYGVDLNTKIHQLYIYSDLASYTFIGDVTAPILRVLPFESKRENNHLHQECVNVHYVPVAKSFIDQVHISIKGDTGENVPFISGKTLVKLHFRQKE